MSYRLECDNDIPRRVEVDNYRMVEGGVMPSTFRHRLRNSANVRTAGVRVLYLGCVLDVITPVPGV